MNVIRVDVQNADLSKIWTNGHQDFSTTFICNVLGKWPEMPQTKFFVRISDMGIGILRVSEIRQVRFWDIYCSQYTIDIKEKNFVNLQSNFSLLSR